MAAVFLCLTVPRLLLHELWRDEAWLWLVVTEPRSLADLLSPLSPLARSGQGYLFPVLCLLAAQLSTSPLAMQLLHGALATAAAFVVARWAPWDRTLRALLVLGYFTSFEYAVISRHYVVGALLVWVASASTGRTLGDPVGGAALGLLCQTTVYGYILSAALAADGCPISRDRGACRGCRSSMLVTGVCLALAGAVAGLLQLSPRPETIFAPPWHSRGIPRSRSRPWRRPDAFVPLPRPGLHFWNSNLLDPWPWHTPSPGCSWSGWPPPSSGATRPPWPPSAWAGQVSSPSATSSSPAPYATAATGGCCSRPRAGWRAPPPGGRPTDLASPRPARPLQDPLCGRGVCQLDGRPPPVLQRGRHRAADPGAGLDRYALVAGREPNAAPVALALGAPFYFPGRDGFGTYPDWGPAQLELTDHELRCRAWGSSARREGGDVVLVMERPLPPWVELEEVGARLGAIVPAEDYRLYRLRLSRLEAGGPTPACGTP